MAKEVERKFLVVNTLYRELATSSRHIVQGYLCRDRESTVRVRVVDNRAYLTVKGITKGITRNEWEYEIPVDDGREMLCCCRGSVIDKTRYIVPAGNGLEWEVDEFHNVRGLEVEDNAMLAVAEIELTSEDCKFDLPQFIGREVSNDPRYYNSNLQTINCCES